MITHNEIMVKGCGVKQSQAACMANDTIWLYHSIFKEKVRVASNHFFLIRGPKIRIHNSEDPRDEQYCQQT